MDLERRINDLASSEKPERSVKNLALLEEFRAALNRGEIRVAEPGEGAWRINLWVKKGILLHTAMGVLQDVSVNGGSPQFELDTFPRRQLCLENEVRIPPEGSIVRDGVYLSPGVTCLPPTFINMGAYIGRDTLLDSHTMIGICTQIGERVQVGPGVQIGGTIHPPERLPTIISDDVLIGGNCGIYDGVFIGRGAVLAAGTVLTGHSRVYDLIRNQTYKRSSTSPLAIPPMALIIPGAVQIDKDVARGAGLMVLAALVVGYRDDPKTTDDVLSGLLD